MKKSVDIERSHKKCNILETTLLSMDSKLPQQAMYSTRYQKRKSEGDAEPPAKKRKELGEEGEGVIERPKVSHKTIRTTKKPKEKKERKVKGKKLVVEPPEEVGGEIMNANDIDAGTADFTKLVPDEVCKVCAVVVLHELIALCRFLFMCYPS